MVDKSKSDVALITIYYVNNYERYYIVALLVDKFLFVFFFSKLSTHVIESSFQIWEKVIVGIQLRPSN